MESQTDHHHEDAAPPRTAWIIGLALLQALGCWLFPKLPLVAAAPVIAAAPVAFYCSERYLARHSWLPGLILALFWLPCLLYIWYVDSPAVRSFPMFE